MMKAAISVFPTSLWAAQVAQQNVVCVYLAGSGLC